METSKLGNVIATTRLLPYFTSENVAVMRSCIVKQLGFNNESQFLCDILQTRYKSLSNKSSAIIKNKAVELASLQTISLQLQPINTETRFNYNYKHCHVESQSMSLIKSTQSMTTVCKYIDSKNSDILSKINTDIIDYIGAFLTKQESIQFGYLNKQLYIETQKLSYLLKRCNDDQFNLNGRRVHKLLISKNSGYNYTIPTKLSLFKQFAPMGEGCKDRKDRRTLSQKEFFANFFLRLNELTCESLPSLGYIPIDLVFNKNINSNFYDSDVSREYISHFGILTNWNHSAYSRLLTEKFCNNFENFQKINGLDNMRKIKYFTFGVNHESKNEALPMITTKAFLLCASISESIDIRCRIDSLNIFNLTDFKTIFHDNLKCFSFSGINDNENSNNINKVYYDNHGDKDKGFDILEKNLANNYNHNYSLKVGMLEELRIKSYLCFKKCVHLFDKFEMRRNIKRYQMTINKFMMNAAMELMNKILFNDAEKHQLLEKIVFVVEDGEGLEMVLDCLNKHKKRSSLAKLSLKHLKTIELWFDSLSVTRIFNAKYKISKEKDTRKHHQQLPYPEKQSFMKFIDLEDVFDWLRKKHCNFTCQDNSNSECLWTVVLGF